MTKRTDRLENIVADFLRKRDFESARHILLEVIDKSISSNNEEEHLYGLLQMADLCGLRGDQMEELAYLQKARVLSARTIKGQEVLILEKLADYYHKNEQHQEEYQTLERILSLKQAAFDKEKREKINELQKKYETQEKDKLIEQEKGFNETLKAKNKDLSEALAKQKRLDLHLKSLQLQLSPHFIFNTLQSIQSYIFQQDPVEASDYLAKFASLMRSILHAAQQDGLSLKEEVDLLSQYLALEQMRFDSSFQYQISVEESIDIDKEQLPSLLLQPFIENAILHGVVGVREGLIRIIFRKKKQGLYIHIIDNGVGRAAARKVKKQTHQGSSTALKIMNERAKLSKKSKRFTYDFVVRDKLEARKILGTHVLVCIQNKIKEDMA